MNLSAPNGRAQADLVQACLTLAHLPSERMVRAELSANGSFLGDAVEVRSLSTATCRGPRRASHQPFGSGKGAWGHGEAGCGLPSLANLMVTLRQWSLAPNAQLRTLSPHVGDAISGKQISISTARSPLPPVDLARGSAGGVSSFAAAGTLVHVVLGSPSVQGKCHAPVGPSPLRLRRRAFVWCMERP